MRLVAYVWLSLLSTVVFAGDKLDQLFDQNPHDPGCAVGVSRGEKIEYLKGFGMANLEHQVPITNETRFHVASVSKQFTAVAIAILAMEGKLKLTDDVRTYIPDFPEYRSPITINHLLQHSSGLKNHTKLMGSLGIDYGNALTQKDALNLVFREDLNFEPGSQFEYTSGYLVLGSIVEVITQQPLRDFLNSQIFEPLGMQNSGLHDDLSIIPNRAEGYFKKNNEWVNDRIRYTLIGSGGVHMTIGDLLTWNHALRNDKLKPGLATLMFESQPMRISEQAQYHFGLIRSVYRGKPTFTHSGSYEGTRTMVYSYEPKMTIAISCNHPIDVTQLMWKVLAEVSQSNEVD